MPRWSNMDNGSITGKAYPASLAEAYYEVVRLWVIPSQKKAVTTSLALVATEDSSRMMKSGWTVEAVGRVVAVGTGGRGGRGLPKKRSPPPKPLKNKDKFEESKSSGKVDMTGWVVRAGCKPDSKTCKGCLKKGHIWANCPDRVSTSDKAVVGQEEDDWKSDDEDDRATKIERPPYSWAERKPGIAMHFPQWDSAPRRSGKRPVHYVWYRRQPVRSTSSQDRKIGATVGLAGKASANILAQARLVDAGYGVRYDSALDHQYEVDTDSRPMIFTRRDRRKGKQSPHYSHVIEQASVETVTRIKARFTRREGTAAEIGKEFLFKFAHGSYVERRHRPSRERNKKTADRERRHKKSKDHLEIDRGVYHGKKIVPPGY